MDFLKPAKYFFILSTVLTIASVIAVFVPGPRLGIEFTGGTRLELQFKQQPTLEQVAEVVKATLGEENPLLNINDVGAILLRVKPLEDKQHTALLAALSTKLGEVKETQYTTIGPTVGSSLKQRSMVALLLASAGIIIYLALAFQGIPRKYDPWKFGVVAVATLLHDVMVTVGLFVILSYTSTFEVDTIFITALLIILGYSVNDTIIIFDRIRENLSYQTKGESFAVIANRSIGQGVKRSCFTSLSTLLVLIALFFFGPASIQWFVLALIVGIMLGTYSSIFVATPLLVYWSEKSSKQNN